MVRTRRLGVRKVTAVAATIVCAAVLALSGQVAAGGATPNAAHPVAGQDTVAPGPFSKTAFNLPNSAFSTNIRTLEMSLIEDAPDGSAIELSAYRFTDVALARQLVRDARKGVQVEVLLDGGVPTDGCAGAANCINPAYTVLQKLNNSYYGGLGSPTWMRTCAGIGPANPWTTLGIGRGCIGQDLDHNKFLLLSYVPDLDKLGAQDVVFQSSSNNTPKQYQHALNNAVVIANRPTVYQDYLRYFEQLTLNSASGAQTSSQWFNPFTGNHVDTTTLADHDIATWTFPRPPDDDPVANVLADVSTAHHCANRIGSATGPKRTHIKAAIADIKGRGAVMRQLASLQQSGCRVTVVYATITPRDKHILRRSGVALDAVCTVPDRQKYPDQVNQYVHSKYLLVEGTDNELGRNRRIVYTGSENWTNKSLTGSDNLMMRYVEPANSRTSQVANSPLFDRYSNNFHALQMISAFNKEKAHCAAADR